MNMKKYLYMLTPILSYWGAVALVVYATIRFARDKALRQEYSMLFSIRFMLYYAPLVMIPVLLVEQFFLNRVSPVMYLVILFGVFYLSGVIATKLLCNWMKKVGI